MFSIISVYFGVVIGARIKRERYGMRITRNTMERINNNGNREKKSEIRLGTEIILI